MSKNLIDKFYIFVFFLFIFGGIGFFINIYKFCTSDFEEPYKSEIVRGIGIPVPIIGAVVGWMDIGDEGGKNE